MQKTKALLVLAILMLVAAALGVAWHWADDGFPDPGADPARYPGHELAVDPTPEARLGGDAAVEAPGEGAAESANGNREQIAEGRSGDQRPVRLRFRCETLRHNVMGVWNHMKLKVHLEDEA
ncbi:MAG: hypothetical protein V3U11_12215, partial [Planctomycetota bacterium]